MQARSVGDMPDDYDDSDEDSKVIGCERIVSVGAGGKASGGRA